MLRPGFTANPWGNIASEWASTIKELTEEDWEMVLEHVSAHIGGIDSDDDAELDDEDDEEGVSSEGMSLTPRTTIQPN